VDRYSFIVVDLHHLLLAGLPAHFESYMPSHAVGLTGASQVAACMLAAGDTPAPDLVCERVLFEFGKLGSAHQIH
jgi:hypothetical protein